MPITLSEADSKALLTPYGIPFVPEQLVVDPAGAADAARKLGTPAVAKLCGANISHKTERGLVRLNLADPSAVAAATAELLAAATPGDGATGVLIAPMLHGTRELIAGLATDAQFGPTVLVGIGGVLAEAIGDVSVCLAPISALDAYEMIEDLCTQSLLGEVRGDPPVDRDCLAQVLMALSHVAEAHPEIISVDLNPLIVSHGTPVAVDALVELEEGG